MSEDQKLRKESYLGSRLVKPREERAFGTRKFGTEKVHLTGGPGSFVRTWVNPRQSSNLLNPDANRRTPPHLRGEGKTWVREGKHWREVAPPPPSRGGCAPVEVEKPVMVERTTPLEAPRYSFYSLWAVSTPLKPRKCAPVVKRPGGRKRKRDARSRVRDDEWWDEGPLGPKSVTRVVTLVKGVEGKFLEAYANPAGRAEFIAAYPSHKGLMTRAFRRPDVRDRLCRGGFADLWRRSRPRYTAEMGAGASRFARDLVTGVSYVLPAALAAVPGVNLLHAATYVPRIAVGGRFPYEAEYVPPLRDWAFFGRLRRRFDDVVRGSEGPADFETVELAFAMTMGLGPPPRPGCYWGTLIYVSRVQFNYQWLVVRAVWTERFRLMHTLRRHMMDAVQGARLDVEVVPPPPADRWPYLARWMIPGEMGLFPPAGRHTPYALLSEMLERGAPRHVVAEVFALIPDQAFWLYLLTRDVGEGFDLLNEGGAGSRPVLEPDERLEEEEFVEAGAGASGYPEATPPTPPSSVRSVQLYELLVAWMAKVGASAPFELRDVVCMVGILTATSRRELMLHLLNLCTGQLLRPYLISVRDVTRKVAAHFPGYLAESGGAGRMAGKVVKTVLHSPISKQIAAIVTTVAGMMAFAGDPGVDAFLAKSSVFLGRAGTCVSGVEQVTQLVSTWESALEDYRETKDLLALFGSSAEENLLREAERLVQDFKELRDMGDARSESNVIALVGKARRLSHQIVRYPSHPLIVACGKELVTAIVRAQEAFRVLRKRPAAFIITGPPGCGKTYLTDLVHKCMRQRLSLPSSVSVLHSWQDGKHQQLGTVVSVVLLNDVGGVKDEYTEGIRFLDLCQKLADDAPFYTEGASIEDKANGYLAPDIVLATTNADSFVATTSSGGGGKLDRRYKVIHCEWTEEAFALADADEVARFFETASDEVRATMVRYSLGTMCNTDAQGRAVSNVIKFGIARKLDETTDVFQVVKWVMDAEKGRTDNRKTLEVCVACHYPRSVCTCPPDGAKYVTQGAGMSVQLRHEVSAPDVDRLETYAKGAAILMGLMAMSSVIHLALAIVKGVRDSRPYAGEGTIQSVTNVADPPEGPPYVQPYTATSAAWLGAADHLEVGLAQWESGGYQFFVPVTNSLFALTGHFFSGKTAGEGLSLTLTSGSRVRVLYDPGKVVEVGSDMVILHVDHFPNLVHNVYHRLFDTPSFPRESVTFKGGVATMVSNGGPLHYRTSSEKGDCGTPLLGKSGMIYGLHVGVYEAAGVRVACPLTKGMVQTAMRKFNLLGMPVERHSSSMPEPLVKEGAKLSPGVALGSDLGKFPLYEPVVAQLSDNYVACHIPVRETPKFSVRQTSLYPLFAHKLAGAYGPPYAGKAKLVEDGTWNGPFVASYRNMAVNPTIDSARMRRAVDSYLSGIPAPPVPLVPYSDRQAIVGDRRSVLLNGRDTTKSIGPRLQALGLSKETAFKQVGADWEVHPTVLSEIAALQEELEGDGPLGLSMARATVKDEAYPEAKARLGKGRLFYVQDWTVNHQMRKYILPLASHLMMNPRESGVNVVINAASPQWAELADHLCPPGHDGRLFSADQTAYDLKHSVMIPYYISFMVALAAKCGYSERDQRIVRRLLLRVTRHVVLVEGNWVIRNSTLGSGRSDTIIMNCVVLAIMLHYCSLGVYPSEDPRDVMVYSLTGDDSLVSPKPGHPLLTGPALAGGFSEGGYVLTDSHKRAIVQLERLSDIRYLKRGFVEGQMRGVRVVLAPLEEESIYRSLCYSVGVKSGEERARDLSAASSALREMFLHGESKYLELAGALESSFGKTLNIPRFADLESSYLDGTLGSWVPTVGAVEPCDFPSPGYSGEGGGRDQPPAGASGGMLSTSRGAPKGDFPVPKPSSVTSRCAERRILSAANPTSLNATEALDISGTDQAVQETRAVETDQLILAPSRSFFGKPPNDYSQAQILSRPRLVGSYSVAASTTGINPFALWKVLPGVDHILDQYGMFRGDLVLNVVWTGSSVFIGKARVYGNIVASNLNSGPYEGAGPWLPDLVAANRFLATSQLPHLDIDLSEPCNKLLRLPYPNPNEYMMISNGVSWSVGIEMVTALSLASGLTPPVVNVEFYVHYENVTLHRLTLQSGSGEAPPGFLERALAYTRRVVALAPEAPFATPALKALTLGEMVARFHGWSRPPVEPQSAVVAWRQGNFALAGGQPNFGRSLALDPGAQANVDVTRFPMASEGETTFKSLVSRRTQVFSDWTTGYAYPCVPGAVLDDGTRIYPGPLAYVSCAFERWKGGITYCVEVVSSPLVRWRIGVNVVPPLAVLPVAYVSNGSIPGYVIEVIGSTCTEITVPYQLSIPWGATGFVVAPTTSTAHARLVWFPLMASAGPATTPIVPKVNLYSWAGEDFSVGIPDLTAFELYQPESGLGQFSAGRFGEVVDDLLLLTRRAVILRSWTLAAGNVAYFPMLPPLPSGPLSPGLTVGTGVTMQDSWTWRFWLSTMFIGNSGGMAWKVRVAAPPAHGNSVTITTDLASPTLGVLTTVAMTGSRGAVPYDDKNVAIMEFTIPDRNPNAWRYPSAAFAATPAECLVVHSDVAFSADARITVWDAAAEDFVVGGFFRVPTLIPRASV